MARYLYAKKHEWQGVRPMSIKRVKDVWHMNLRQFFAWLSERKLYAGPSPIFKTLPKNYLRKPQMRTQWNEEELLKLFSQPLFSGCQSQTRFWTKGDKFVQNELYWAYILMLFTGMRNSEIGSLRTDDLIEDKNGNWIFDLHVDPDEIDETDDTPVQRKTENAERKIPIHPFLIELGLIDRWRDLKKAGTQRFFPEWSDYKKPSKQAKPGNHFSKSWQYLNEKCGFQRKGLTLYGLRHTRAGLYDAVGLATRLRKLLLGHALELVDEKYGGRELTEAEMETIRNLPLTKIEKEIIDILLAAKRRAQAGELEVVKTWLHIRPKLKRKPPDKVELRPSAGE